MNNVFFESKINDQYSKLSIDTSLIEIFNTIKKTKKTNLHKPTWVKKLQELIIEEQPDYSLKNLSSILGLHPVHLSREFGRYFGISLGSYIRLLKVNQAFHLIVSNKLSMTEICYQCGFYDQSHFIRNFKKIYGITPTSFLKRIL